MNIKARYAILFLALFTFGQLTVNARMLPKTPSNERHRWGIPRAEAPANTMDQVATSPEVENTRAAAPQQDDTIILDNPDSMQDTSDQVLTSASDPASTPSSTSNTTADAEEDPNNLNLFSFFSLGSRDHSSGGRMGFVKPENEED